MSNYRASIASAFSSLAGVDSSAQELARTIRWHDEIERSCRPSLLMQDQLQQMTSGLSVSAYAREYLTANSVAKILEEQQRLVRDAVGPLAQLRAESIWERERAQYFASAQSSIALQRYTKTIADTQFPEMESVGNAYAGINRIAKIIMDSLDAERWAVIEVASLPYARLAELFTKERASDEALRDVVGGSSWLSQLKTPIIDAASAAAVAKTWGIEGALREIGSLGLDAQTMQALVTSFASTGNVGAWEVDGGDDADRSPSAAKARRLSPEMWLSIFSALLAILVPIWQKMDSDATEARLAAEIKDVVLKLEDHDKKSAERLEALSRMMEQSEPKAVGEVGFVVRSRVALIRTVGTSGSHIVAEVFPNQVVKLVSENGKWIEVRYFDWNAQEERTGWALKKYFVRVNVGDVGVGSLAAVQ